MFDLKAFLKRISTFFVTFNYRSLSTAIVIAMFAGLFLPAFIGSALIMNRTRLQLNNELDEYLRDKLSLIANSLPIQVWNYDTDTARMVLDATLLDPQVVRVTVMISDPGLIPFLSREFPERRLGVSHVAQQRLILPTGEIVGTVELEVADGLKQKNFRQNLLASFMIFFGQFILALFFILLALRHWVLKPLARLISFSNRLAGGDLAHAIDWERQDEMGHLAHQLDRMRIGLRSSFADQRAILSNIRVGVVFVRDGTIKLANRHAEEIFGYGAGQMQGLPTGAIYQTEAQRKDVERRALEGISALGGQYEDELRLQRRGGNPFWARLRVSALDSGSPHAGSIWVIEDITLQKKATDEIEKLAFYDPLTQLPNRRLLLDRLRQAVSGSARNGRHGALLYLDLDHFKTLNDTRGHDTGDLLLQQVAQRLLTCIREGDSVSRLGGDEFVVILENLSTNAAEAAAQGQNVCEKIMKALSKSYQLGSYEHHTTISVGIALFDDRGNQKSTIEELLKQADLALYQAKEDGRNIHRFFDPEMQAVVTTRAALEASLRDGVTNNAFTLYYQGQVDRDGRLTGAEALLRWKHPVRGIVSPAEFIPLAEDTGLILPLGQWVLQTACEQLAAWANRPQMEHLSIAVNVSARQLYHQDFVSQVLGVLEQTGANPRRLKLELTESLLVDDVEDTISKMHLLKAVGVGFSLDDFGTGYSSLSYLKRLPLDQLKIDQSFVRDILHDTDDASIAKMIVVLAESLGLAVIAEGVENCMQRDFLEHQGCYAYQGYLYSRPLPLDAFESFAKGLCAAEAD